MRFKVVIAEQLYAIEVPDELLPEAAEFHAKLDRDMDRGWQMSRQFVERPDTLQRCQIVADKLLTSIMNGNEATAMLMAGVHRAAHARRNRRGHRRLRGDAEYRAALRLGDDHVPARESARSNP